MLRPGAAVLRKAVNDLRVIIYRELRARLPADLRLRLASSPLTAPLRSLLFRSSGRAILVDTDVDFEGHRFRFAAPVQTATTIRRKGGVENGLCRLILREAPPGGVCVDAGANYGFLSMMMALAVGDRGRVLAFEADRQVHGGLARNVAANGFAGRVEAIRAFLDASGDGGERTSIDDEVERRGLARVDLIKIDVDGPDVDVLRGARRTIGRFHPVLIVEMGREPEAILELVRAEGYTACDMEGRPVVPGRWPGNLLAAVGRALAVPPRRSQV